MNLSVVAFCWDDKHKENLQRCMLERGVESLVTGTTNIFMDSSLRSRALQFHFINEDPEKDKDKTSSKKHKEGTDSKKDKKGKDSKKDKDKKSS